MDIRYGGHATRERAAIVSKIVVKSFERKQATVDKPPLLLDRNERSFRLGILMHRLSLLHPSSSPPSPFPTFHKRGSHATVSWLFRRFPFRLSVPCLENGGPLPSPPHPDKGPSRSYFIVLKNLDLPSSPRLPPVFSPSPPLPPLSPRFVNFFPPSRKKNRGNRFLQLRPTIFKSPEFDFNVLPSMDIYFLFFWILLFISLIDFV